MAKTDKKTTHVVKNEFHDIADFGIIYEVGKDVSDFAPDRLAKLVENGHVEEVKDEKPV